MGNLSSKPRGYYERERAELLKCMPQGIRTTLEFDCGFGCFSALRKARLHTESWAVEIHQEAAQEAAEKLDKVIQGDTPGSIAQIPDNHFDCVIFFDVLRHLVDPYSLLLAVKARLTENGVLIASIPNVRYLPAFVDLMVHGNWQYRDEGVPDKTPLRFFTRKSIINTFQQLGFRILTLEGIHPTRSRTCRRLNLVLLNARSDARYMQFVVVAEPTGQSPGSDSS